MCRLLVTVGNRNLISFRQYQLPTHSGNLKRLCRLLAGLLGLLSTVYELQFPY